MPKKIWTYLINKCGLNGCLGPWMTILMLFKNALSSHIDREMFCIQNTMSEGLYILLIILWISYCTPFNRKRCRFLLNIMLYRNCQNAKRYSRRLKSWHIYNTQYIEQFSLYIRLKAGIIIMDMSSDDELRHLIENWESERTILNPMNNMKFSTTEKLFGGVRLNFLQRCIHDEVIFWPILDF